MKHHISTEHQGRSIKCHKSIATGHNNNSSHTTIPNVLNAVEWVMFRLELIVTWTFELFFLCSTLGHWSRMPLPVIILKAWICNSVIQVPLLVGQISDSPPHQLRQAAKLGSAPGLWLFLWILVQILQLSPALVHLFFHSEKIWHIFIFWFQNHGKNYRFQRIIDEMLQIV